MPSPMSLPKPEKMVRNSTIVYVIAVVIAALAIGFVANLLLEVRGITLGSRFAIYNALIFMVLLVAGGLLVHHLFKGLRRKI